MMSGIAEIQEAILALQDNDYAQLRQWFGELDWEKWDREIEADSEAEGWAPSLQKPWKRKRTEPFKSFRCTGQRPVSGDILSNFLTRFNELLDRIFLYSRQVRGTHPSISGRSAISGLYEWGLATGLLR